jgi:deoxyuridine 5'-triphosphate nucleotidohydrolase
MINTKYFDTLDTPEKVYILSLILLNLKEKYNDISLKSEFTIHRVDKGENKSATYNNYIKSKKKYSNIKYFHNINNIINILEKIGDVKISEYNNIELTITSSCLINDIIKHIGDIKLDSIYKQDLTNFIDMLHNISSDYSNQFIKAYIEVYGNIIGKSLYVVFDKVENFLKIGKLYNIPYIVEQGKIGYTIEYRNSDMLDFLGKIYSPYGKSLYINYNIYNFNNNDNLPILKVFKTDCDAVIPAKASYSDTGYDLTIIKEYKNLDSGVILYDTGIKLDIPNGYYVEIVPRSSISKSGYMLANNIGIIDQSYRGNLYVALIKINKDMPDIQLPCKCCQIIFKKQEYVNLEISSEDFSNTNRGMGGFGSTGK